MREPVQAAVDAEPSDTLLLADLAAAIFVDDLEYLLNVADRELRPARRGRMMRLR